MLSHVPLWLHCCFLPLWCHTEPASARWDERGTGPCTWPTENVEEICKWRRRQRWFGICKMNEILSSLFPYFVFHVCVTGLVKSLSLKLPRSTGHRSKELSNMRESERERDGEKVREIGPGMIANCLSNGCHPGSHFRWLVIRHERGRPARIPFLTPLLSGPPLPKSFRLSPVTSPLKTPLSPILDAFSLLFFLSVAISMSLPFPLCPILPAVRLFGFCSAAVV